MSIAADLRAKTIHELDHLLVMILFMDHASKQEKPKEYADYIMGEWLLRNKYETETRLSKEAEMPELQKQEIRTTLMQTCKAIVEELKPLFEQLPGKERNKSK